MTKIPQVSFYFVRHGQTNWNKQSLITGSQDIALNATGLAQAEAAAYELKDMELSKVFTSPLLRAKQTAVLIADICGVEIEQVTDLSERNRGALEGKSNKDPVASDEEAIEAFEIRVIQGIRQALINSYQYPLIVAHAGVFAVLARILSDKTDLSCHNGEVFFFSPSIFRPGRWDLEAIARPQTY